MPSPRAFAVAALCLLSLLAAPSPAHAGDPAPLRTLAPAPAAASGATGSIDPVAATRAYLAELPADKKARSDAYFEGGYWLQLWSFLYGSAVLLVLLQTGLSSRMRALAERVRWRPLQPWAYWLQFLAGHHGARAPALGLPGLVAGAAVRPLQPDAGRVVRRAGQGAAGLGAAGRPGGDGALRRAAAGRPELVGLGRAGGDPVLRRRQRHRAGGHHAALQRPEAAGRSAGGGPHPLAGPRQRHHHRRGLGDRRLQADHPGLRQRERAARHRADHAQRQPAQPHLAAGDRGGHGPRDGPLRPQPRLQGGARVRR